MNLEDIEIIEYEKNNWEDWPSKKTKVTAERLMNIENTLEKLCLVFNKYINEIKEFSRNSTMMRSYISPSEDIKEIGTYRGKRLYQRAYYGSDSNGGEKKFEVDISDIMKYQTDNPGYGLDMVIVDVTGVVLVKAENLVEMVYPIGYQTEIMGASVSVNRKEKKIYGTCEVLGPKKWELLVKFTTETS